MQFKPSRHVMLLAACNAFWDIQLPQLTKIVKEYKIDCECVTLAATLTAVLRHMIKLHTNKAATDKVLQDILALRCADVGDPLEFVCDEDLLIELLDEDDRKEFEDWNLPPRCRRMVTRPLGSNCMEDLLGSQPLL